MARSAPFEEVKNGLPVWRLQVEDPEGAAGARMELSWRRLSLPKGGVMALALKLFDRSGRPLIFHHAVAQGSLGQRNLQSAGGVLAVFERHGWLNPSERRLELNLGPQPEAAPADGGADALAHYVEAYRRLLPLAGTPEGAWNAIEAELAAPAPKAGKGGWAWVLLALALAGAAAAAWFFLKGRMP